MTQWVTNDIDQLVINDTDQWIIDGWIRYAYGPTKYNMVTKDRIYYQETKNRINYMVAKDRIYYEEGE